MPSQSIYLKLLLTTKWKLKITKLSSPLLDLLFVPSSHIRLPGNPIIYADSSGEAKKKKQQGATPTTLTVKFTVFFFLVGNRRNASEKVWNKSERREKINWNSKDSIPKSYIWSYKCNILPRLHSITESRIRMKTRECWNCVEKKTYKAFLIDNDNQQATIWREWNEWFVGSQVRVWNNFQIESIVNQSIA